MDATALAGWAGATNLTSARCVWVARRRAGGRYLGLCSVESKNALPTASG
jgi:hypothetical protein